MICRQCGKELLAGAVFCTNCGANQQQAASSLPPKPPPLPHTWSSPPTPPAQPKQGAGAIILIVAVVGFFLLAIVGIIAAIAIPNLLNAIQRGKQKRTMADIRSIGVACESYAVDNRFYPEAATMTELSSKLVPTYIKALPARDAWEHEFRYFASHVDSGGPQQYVVVSAGKDGIFEKDIPDEYQPGGVANFDGDIVFLNGSFLRYPEASQSQTTFEQNPSLLSDPAGILQVTLPSGWKEDKDLNDQADIQASDRSRELYLVVLSESKEDFDSITLQEHSDLTRNSLLKATSNSRVVGPVRMDINGNPALQYEIAASVDEVEVTYLHTTLETSGHFHQILAWTLQSRFASSEPELQQVVLSIKPK